MIVGLVLVVVLVVVVFKRHGRKVQRNVGGDALVQALGLVKPYKGKPWKVPTDRWL